MYLLLSKEHKLGEIRRISSVPPWAIHVSDNLVFYSVLGDYTYEWNVFLSKLRIFSSELHSGSDMSYRNTAISAERQKKLSDILNL